VRGGGLSGHDIVAYNSSIPHWPAGQLGGEPLGDARIVLRTNSTSMLVKAVRLGLGIGPLPCFLARADRTLERVPSATPSKADELWLVVHEDVRRTTRVRAVIDAMEARLSQVEADLSDGSEG
jgi:DNA-binding transcriptional LysR family regulator